MKLADPGLWHLECLRKAGFTMQQAEELAEADWHQAAAMLEAGCPPQLVLEILSKE